MASEPEGTALEAKIPPDSDAQQPLTAEAAPAGSVPIKLAPLPSLSQREQTAPQITQQPPPLTSQQFALQMGQESVPLSSMTPYPAPLQPGIVSPGNRPVQYSMFQAQRPANSGMTMLPPASMIGTLPRGYAAGGVLPAQAATPVQGIPLQVRPPYSTGTASLLPYPHLQMQM